MNYVKYHDVYCIHDIHYIYLYQILTIMATITVEKRRKNIDLPIETLQKLSIMAASQGKSLKAFIENVLVTKAEGLSVEVSTNPSPSNDPWFDDPENIVSVERGIEDAKKGKVKAYSMDEIRNLLGV